jgi:hypothetical protein
MLTDILRPAPVSSIDGGNRLSLRVTRGVRQAVAGPAFRDTRFMSELDVVFAKLYFAAIAEGEIDVSRAPSAWRPLLRCRTQRGIARLQFALAGMNAHIAICHRGSWRSSPRLAAIPLLTPLAVRTSTA